MKTYIILFLFICFSIVLCVDPDKDLNNKNFASPMYLVDTITIEDPVMLYYLESRDRGPKLDSALKANDKDNIVYKDCKFILSKRSYEKYKSEGRINYETLARADDAFMIKLCFTLQSIYMNNMDILSPREK